jgi:WD40 repeat protein
MGKLESGEEVNNVKTPCHDNPYDFIMTMRSVLENSKLSKTIQNWIDLIFGYKARGKEAENANNLFSEASYQESIDINKVENKESYLRMVEFGLIPTQIMNKECSKREKKQSVKKGKEITDSTCDLKYYVCKALNGNDSIKITPNLSVLRIMSFSSDKIILLLNNYMVMEKKISYSTFDKNYSYEYSNITQLQKYPNRMSDYYYSNKLNSKVFHFCQKGKILMMGGFYDGKVQIVSFDQKVSPMQIIPFTDKVPVLAVCVDKDEEFAFFGNLLGNIRVLKLDKELSNYKFYNSITDHISPISHIDCNSELNLWVSASIDGYINLYTLPLSKFLRSIKVPTLKCDFVFLSASPLPSIIVICEEKNISEIIVYSINGKLLLRQKEQAILSCPLIINDLNRNDYLAYILNDSVIIRSIPTLIMQVCIDGVPNIYAIYPSEDMKVLYGCNKSGNEIYVIKDHNKNIK